MNIIKNTNGAEYALIGTDSESEYSLLKGGGQYVVAWKLHEVGGGLHEWEQGHYHNDLYFACVSFMNKVAPFDC